jgi:hypothetical protein
MSTQPRISAPIGRLKIRASARKRVASAVARLQASEPSCESEAAESIAPERENAVRRYYPFAPRLVDDCDR